MPLDIIYHLMCVKSGDLNKIIKIVGLHNVMTMCIYSIIKKPPNVTVKRLFELFFHSF